MKTASAKSDILFGNDMTKDVAPDNMDFIKKQFSRGVNQLKLGYKTITGQTVEEKVTEFSETYGEILLGLDRELESIQKKTDHLQAASETTSTQLRMHEERLEQLQQQLERLMQLERSRRGTMRRTITIAVITAIVVTAALEGILLWIRD